MRQSNQTSTRILLNTDLKYQEKDTRNRVDTCDLHNIFIQRDMKCYILNNDSNIFIELLLNLLIKSMAIILLCFLYNKGKSLREQSKAYRFFMWVNRFFGFAFFVEAFSAFEIDLVTSSLINTRSLWVYPFKLWLNSTIALLVLILYLTLAKKLIIKSYFLEKFRERYGFYPLT